MEKTETVKFKATEYFLPTVIMTCDVKVGSSKIALENVVQVEIDFPEAKRDVE